MRILALGEILWDVIGDQEYLGGATFNFSAHATRLGADVELVSAVGKDERGRRALQRARELGVSTARIREVEAATGWVSVRLKVGQPDYTIHRPAAYDFASLSTEDWRAIEKEPPDWVYFGTLCAMDDSVRALLGEICRRLPQSKRFYDVNLRRDSYSRELLEELLGQADVVKLNEDETVELGRLFDEPPTGTESFCRRWAERFEWEGVCVTRGAEGCAVCFEDFFGGTYREVPGVRVQVRDAVGAGDAFSAAFLTSYAGGAAPAEGAAFANRVGALVASRSGAVPDWSIEEAAALEG